ncbi:MAG: alpha-glucosidase C-terminal domain-containing protein, partial [Acidobacteriaceae bacterium]|nr:alpha-glucosidase C-terminal domain-containing protein [Acidobacteriaceae bacterium]
TQAKERGIRVICDLVLNHTSDKHPWFIESESSRTNPKADWYIWHDGKQGGAAPNNPPNNWQSIFGHSAWEYVKARDQYYYHAFYKQQPDLNWRNDQVKDAMFNVVRFWTNKGVAGFRLDAITSLFEDVGLKDEPYLAGMDAYGERNISRIYTDNLPEVHDILRQLRTVANEKDAVLIGETYLPNVGELAKMYGRNDDELQLPMDTQLGFAIKKLSTDEVRSKLEDAETKIGGNVPLFVFENHDNPRSLNRFGDGKHNGEIARLLATLLLTPRDAALIYYGEELGMVNNNPKRKEDVQDPIGKTGWPKEKGRDGERTPMQWNAEKGGGFSEAGKTWLPIAPDYKTVNVADEEKDPNSLLNYYKKLIRLRKDNQQLRDGDFVSIESGNENVLSYLRKTNDGKAVIVALNFTSSRQTVSYDLSKSGVNGKNGKLLLASFANAPGDTDLSKVNLPAYGSWVAEVQ